MAKTVKDGGVYKHNLARVEVGSIVKPLYDKEPTPAWVKQFKAMLKHFKISAQTLYQLTAESGKTNEFGHPYTTRSMANLLNHYKAKNNGWTKNAQQTINDHLDILIEHLCRLDDAPADPYRSVTSYGITDIYPSPNQIAQEEEPKNLLQRLEESGRKPFLPKSGYKTIHKSEYVPYKQKPKTLNEQRAEIGLAPMPIKVKLTKIHIIRR